MARRRLQTLLATTVLATGLSAAPALGDTLGDLTDTVEGTTDTLTETVTETSEDVASTTEETLTDTVETVTGTEESTEPTDTASDDDQSTVDAGTGDGTLDADLDVDVAPSDEDGSPQLEIDGGVTIADQDVDLGSMTDPIEDAVDPDPQPSPSPSPRTDTSSDSTEGGSTGHRSDGGLLSGGGVVAAGDDARPFGSSQDGGSAPHGSALGQGFAAFGARDRGGFGAQRYGGGTMALDRVQDPEVAPPLYESPRIADRTPQEPGVETPAVLATGTVPGLTDDSPMAALLRALAAAMVLGTGVVWTRATRRA